MRSCLFPGQGSQKVGMGRELFEKYPKLIDEANNVLGYSIKELCLKDPQKRLGFTQFTQPALYTVNAMTFMAASDKPAPEMVAGHSLGEYNALLFAGVFDFATGLQLVKRRGELMAQARNGCMAAVIGIDSGKVRAVLQEEKASSLDIANYNSPVQTVLSGPCEAIEKIESALTAAGARYIVLPVSAAFHSRYMNDAADSFADFLSGFDFQDPRLPVIANVTAKPYGSGSEVAEMLVSQIKSPVRWIESMHYLLARGVTNIEEMGPGRVLTNLFAAIKEKAPVQFTGKSDGERPRHRRRHTIAETLRKSPAAASPVVNTRSDNKSPDAAPVENKSTFSPSTAEKKITTPLTTAPLAPAAIAATTKITAETLGSPELRREYGVRYAYFCGGMYKGIASKEMTVRLSRAGLLGFLDTSGRSFECIEADVRFVKEQLKPGQVYGVNLRHRLREPELDARLVELLLSLEVTTMEAGGFMRVTKPLVRYRYTGARLDGKRIVIPHRLLVRVSRPEVAEAFMSPAPSHIVDSLVSDGQLTAGEAEIARQVPVSEDICVESESAWNTDTGPAMTLLPVITRLRDRLAPPNGYERKVRVGLAGGIGTPEGVASSFIMGADFVLVSSINQCTPESGISDVAKDMLQNVNVQDIGYAPSSELFEMGARVQVLRRGVFFPSRATKLYELYRRYDSLDQLDAKTRDALQQHYFKRTFEDIWNEQTAIKGEGDGNGQATPSPKQKMAAIFKWYLDRGADLAISGDAQERVNFQVICSPAMGALNQYVRGSKLEDWRNRHVEVLASRLMEDGAALIDSWLDNCTR